MKVKRSIVNIDQEKCIGCGNCVPDCKEGAIKLVNGKAQVVSEAYCDGLGKCLGSCPVDAITIEEREAEVFDHAAAEKHRNQSAMKKHFGCCAGSMARMVKPASKVTDNGEGSALAQWPVQLHLVPVNAPYWENAELLVCADCVPFALNNFHAKLLNGKKMVIACPKLDDTSSYTDKLAAIIATNSIKSVTVAHMEVPCCNGIVMITRQAIVQSGKDLELNDITIGINGTTK